MLAIAFLATGLVSCSDDDDDPVVIETDSLIGDYIGVTKLILKDGYSPQIGQVAKIQKGEQEGVYTLVLPEAINKETKSDIDTRHGGMQMPTLSLNNVTFTKGADGTYTYSDEEEVITTGDMSITLSKLNVTINGKAMKIDWKAQPKGMPVTLTYSFEGEVNGVFVEMPAFAKDVLGNYKGVAAMAVGSEAMPGDSSIVKVFGQNNGKFTVILPESTAKKENTKAGMQMPTVELKDIEFKANADKTYSFEMAATEVQTPGMTIKLKDIKMIIDANKDMVFTYQLQPGKMPAWIGVTFTTKEEGPSDIVKKIAGEYVGTNTLKVGDSDMPSENNIAQIIAQTGNKITVILPQDPNSDGQGMAMPKIELKDVEINVAEDGTITFGVDKIDVVDPDKEMHVTGDGMKGEIKGDVLKLTYNFKPGKMPMTIEGTFEGTKK